jgi:DNA ligase-1
MSKDLQPMLADNKVKLDPTNLGSLRYPLFISPKFDGVRLRIDPQLGAVSRTHKPIPNFYTQGLFIPHPELRYLDGEAIVGEPTAPDVFQRTQSGLMTYQGDAQIDYYVFDHWAAPALGYDLRYQRVKDIVRTFNKWINHRLILVPQHAVLSPAEVLLHYERFLADGFEGAILRSTTGHYKNGRSTFKEHLLLKFKPREDAEATVIDFAPLERNANPPTRDVFGFQRRSSHQANKVEQAMLGALICRTAEGVEFNIGTGFDDSQRVAIWATRESLRNKTVTFTYQKEGMKDKPRFPVFKGFRHD